MILLAFSQIAIRLTRFFLMKVQVLKLYWSVLVVVVFLPQTSIGQLHQQKDSLRLANGLEGFTTHLFQDSIAQKNSKSPFLFSYNEIDSSQENAVRSIFYQGQYESGAKNGSWVFEVDDLSPQGEAAIEDLRIIQLASGRRSLIRANFKNGLAENYWTIHKTKVNNSVDVDSSFYAKAFFLK